MQKIRMVGDPTLTKQIGADVLKLDHDFGIYLKDLLLHHTGNLCTDAENILADIGSVTQGGEQPSFVYVGLIGDVAKYNDLHQESPIALIGCALTISNDIYSDLYNDMGIHCNG